MKELPPKHESIRGYFAFELYKQMQKNPDIWCVTGDLGYKMLDFIRADFPDRFVNVGAAEQTLLGVGVGLAMEGKIPFCYSITPFLLFRGAETIRNYINHEQIPVKLIGSGFENDYEHDGFSHHNYDDKDLLKLWPNIEVFWPQKEEIEPLVEYAVNSLRPTYINLRR